MAFLLTVRAWEPEIIDGSVLRCQRVGASSEEGSSELVCQVTAVRVPGSVCGGSGCKWLVAIVVSPL